MQSLKELYKAGHGPSSSHTMGPERAVKLMLARYPDADSYGVTLYGSLALTGKGHGTDSVIERTFAPKPVAIIFDTETTELPHPNTMDMRAYSDGAEVGYIRVMSVGGGMIEVYGEKHTDIPSVYPHSTFADIAAYCVAHRMRFPDYVREVEGEDIFAYLSDIWTTMKSSVYEGITHEGVLPGGLNIVRKAKYLYGRKHMDESPQTRENRIVSSYAFAVSEQNADGGLIVTAPTCGSAGVLPSVLLYEQEKLGLPDEIIVNALATGGVIGDLIKTNASISGAECGCQAEIGSACSMAAAALAELFGMGISQIEYAAEVAMEHHLGLTCDPIHGLVQIPCIERNAVAAMRALNALSLANFLTDTRKISFDLVIRTMYETGRDLGKNYRETSEGGLAKLYM